MDFSNKTVVITGGSNGIGKCMVEEFRKAGGKVAVIDLDPESVDCELYYCGDIAIWRRWLCSYAVRTAAL